MIERPECDFCIEGQAIHQVPIRPDAVLWFCCDCFAPFCEFLAQTDVSIEESMLTSLKCPPEMLN